MTRKEARDLAFKLLYQVEMQNETAQNIIDIYYEENELTGKGKDYVEEILFGATEKSEVIDDIISGLSESWKLNRISKVSISLIRLSVYEIMYRDDIPDNVSINEAVDLAKLYEGEESASFVNGILAAVLKKKVAQ